MQMLRPEPFLLGLAAAVVANGLACASALGQGTQPTKKEVADLLASPSADLISPEFLKPAVKQAVANGLATLLARITVEGNEQGLTVPPAQTMKVVEILDKPAKRITVNQPVYEHEYAEVEKIAPVYESGQPTGRFQKVKDRIVVKSKQVGTRSVEKLVPDPNGSETIKVPKYGPGGPAAWGPGLPGLNGMSLYVLARAGLGGHPAVKKLADGLADHANEFNGLPDSTFDVAWMAAGFAALGPESPHDGVARRLIDKLIDGQVREKGDLAGLWGPVCVNYGYYGKLMTLGQTVRQELDLHIPKKMQTASPAEQEKIVAMGREMKAVAIEYEKIHRDVFRAGTRMLNIQAAYAFGDHAILPGLPVNGYQWVVADVESTDAAAFAIAAAKKAGMLPRETERLAIRGKGIHAPVKTDAAMKLAAKRLADAIDDDGGSTTLAGITENRGFDKTGFPAPSFANDDLKPTMFDLQTACSCLAALDAIESLIAADPGLAKQFAEPRKRARARAAKIASRWYAESANPAAEPWRSVYLSMKISHEDLKKSGKLPEPAKDKTAVESIPWGSSGSLYQIIPDLRAIFAEQDSVKDRYESDLFRQIAYRIVSLQDENGQWAAHGSPLFSTASELLTINRIAVTWHKTLKRDPPGKLGVPDPVTYESMLKPEAAGWIPSSATRPDPASFPTLACLLFLLDAVDGPVSLDGIGILPVPEDEPKKEGDATKPAAHPTAADIAKKVVRPNTPRQELADAIVATRWRAAEAESSGGGKKDADEKNAEKKETEKKDTEKKDDGKKKNKKENDEQDDGLGKFEDLLNPSK